MAGDIPDPVEALGPPSPARGSAGACAPQPPTVAPRKARLGKAMARRSLAGDDTGLLLSVPQPPHAHHSDADDDVMAISPPTCAPIDLSSSDERSTPLVDVKKENEGPTCAASRKPDALALREHNSTTTVSENTTATSTDAAKPVKRRYSKPKLEIDMKDTQLEESCKTNGIGEHVKLQKRRKVSIDQTSLMRVETVTKETKKKSPQTKRTPKTPSEKRTTKRKSDSTSNTPKAKRMLMDSSSSDEKGPKPLAILAEDPASLKPKTKSALLLDNLIRKNSIDRADAKEINPAELFFSPGENICTTSKKTLNINNNIVESNPAVTGVRSNTIAAVSQLIEKKLAFKNACKLEKIDSKITHSSKSVLKPPTDKMKINEDFALISDKYKTKSEKSLCKGSEIKSVSTIKDKGEPIKDNVEDLISDSDNKNNVAVEDALKSLKISKPKIKAGNKDEVTVKPAYESHITLDKPMETMKYGENKPSETQTNKAKRCKLSTNKTKLKKSIEKVAKLLVSKKPIPKTDETACGDTIDKNEIVEEILDKASEKAIKLPKTNSELKAKSIERVAKLLVSKKHGIDTDPIPVPEEKEPKRKSIEAIIDVTPEKTMPEKTLPKRCKLANGEMKAKNVEKVVKLLVSKKPAIKTDEATLVIEDACASSPGPHVGRRARRRRSGAGMRRVRRTLAPLAPPSFESRAPPRWSNGWKWDGENYISKVYRNVSKNVDRYGEFRLVFF